MPLGKLFSNLFLTCVNARWDLLWKATIIGFIYMTAFLSMLGIRCVLNKSTRYFSYSRLKNSGWDL